MKKQSIMSIGAHADDVEIHSGGTLAKFHDQGYEIVYVQSTNNMSGGVGELQPDGSIKRWTEPPVQMMKRRKGECDDGAALLGTTPIHLDHPQRHFHNAAGEQIELRYGCEVPEGVPMNVPSILTAHEDGNSVQRVVDLILERDPACLFTHGIRSTSVEHVTTCLLVTKSYWKAVELGFTGAFLHWQEDYTSLGVSNAQWDTHIDITDHLERKMELIGKHKCQMPTAHCPENGHRFKARKRGSVCGCGAAETFLWVGHDRRVDLDSKELSCSSLQAELNQNTRRS